MSALGHYLEDEGIATTLISLVRLHTEKIRPPRALWVPFELGRPLGTPKHPVFQRRVLSEMLGLLDCASGPVLKDFEEDAPGSGDDSSWMPPIEAAPVNWAQTSAGALAALEQEVGRLAPHYETFTMQQGRSTVGVSGLQIGAVAGFVCAFLGEDLPRDAPSGLPWPGLAGAHALRYAADDLRSFYLEAALSARGQPSSRQLNDWYWQRTIAGQVVKAVRANAIERGDKLLRMVAPLVLVPADQLTAK